MDNVTHAPGTFCWPELTTSDGPGAQKFYTALMPEWTAQADEIPGGGVYIMLQMNGASVGAMFQMTEEMKGMGIPPNWLSYVSVEDVEASASKAKELGGTVVQGPMDVMEIGRMAVLRDPFGATFALWQPKAVCGMQFNDGRPGTACWFELATRDEDRSATFYSNLFDWKPETVPSPMTTYTIFSKDGEKKAGMLKMTEEWGECPPNWMVYFAVDDCDAAAKRAAANGGEVMVPPTDIPPWGRFSVIKDPQGAMVSLIKTSPMPED